MVGEGLESWFQKVCKEKVLSKKKLEQHLLRLNTEYPSDCILGDIVETKVALNLGVDCEELYWEQRAWVNWMKNDDCNTPFFHKFASERR